jgi:hypothetical protein
MMAEIFLPRRENNKKADEVFLSAFFSFYRGAYNIDNCA